MKTLNKFSLFLFILVISISAYGCGGGDSDDGGGADGDIDKSIDKDQDPALEFDQEEGAEDGDGDVDGDKDSGGEDDVDEDGDKEPDTDTNEDAEEDENISSDGDEEPDQEPDSDGDIPVDGDDEIDDVEIETEIEIEAEPEMDAVEEELELELTCQTDLELSKTDLPYSQEHTTLGAGNTISTNGCDIGAMPGEDFMVAIEVEKLDILEISATPMEGNNVSIYVLDDCNEGAQCLAGTDAADSSAAESLSLRVLADATLYILIDSPEAGVAGSFDLSISLGEDGDKLPGEVCQDHTDCDSASGAGICLQQGRFDVSFCTAECVQDGPCPGFNSGCCKEVPEYDGWYCHLANYCDGEGTTATLGETCASIYDPNQPLCDIMQGAELCMEDRRDAYCSHTCIDNSSCSDFADSCCIRKTQAAESGYCVQGSDCPQACEANIEVSHAQFPINITGQTTTGKENDVNAFGCKYPGTPGRDVVISLDLYADEELEASLTYAPNFDAVLYITDTCGWSEDECAALVDEAGFGSPEKLRFIVPSDGTYFLVIDSVDFAQAGQFLLSLSIDQGSTDGDEELDTELELEAEAEMEMEIETISCNPVDTYSNAQLTSDVEIMGDTTNAANDFQQTGCAADLQLGRDDYYAVELLTGDTLYADLFPDGDWNPSLSVYLSCESGACDALTDSGLAGQGEFLEWQAPSAGTYYIVIDSPSPGSDGYGGYTLTLSLSDPNSDGDIEEDTESSGPVSCTASDYTSIGAFSDLAGDGYTDSATTTGGSDNSDLDTEIANCLQTPAPGPDAIYAIDLEYQDTIWITLSDVGDDFDPILYISNVCANPTVCNTGADNGGINAGEQLSFEAPADGTYYIVIDGPRAEDDPSGGWYGSGSYTLTVTQVNN